MHGFTAQAIGVNGIFPRAMVSPVLRLYLGEGISDIWNQRMILCMKKDDSYNDISSEPSPMHKTTSEDMNFGVDIVL